jgi:ankyrin repeat protein
MLDFNAINANTYPLHEAARAGNIEAIRALIAAGADVNTQRQDGDTPLHEAAFNGHTEVVQALIALNANIHAINQYHGTPLHEAVSEGHSEIARALIAVGAHIDAADKNGETPLHYAAVNNQLKTVQTLLELNANIHSLNDFHSTPLHEAAIEGHAEVVQALIAARVNVNAADSDSDTPLNEAAREGHTATLQALIAAGADIHHVNNNGETSIVIAFENGYHNVVRFLQAHGAVLPEYLRERAREAGIEINARQSTHTASVHESISDSALKLTERYGIEGLQVARDEASAWLEGATLDNLKNEFLRKLETAKKILPTLLENKGINLSSSTEALKALQLNFLKNDLPDFSNLDESAAQDYLSAFIERHHNEYLKIQRTQFLPKLEAAKRCLPRILDSTFIDARSEISTPDAIGLVWLGLECPDIINLDNGSIDRLIIFVNHLYEIQRGYNLNALGEDNGKDDKNICAGGTFNKLIDTLNGMHRDVITLFVTPETIRFKAQALVNALCEKLPDDEKLKYAKIWMTGDKAPPQALLEFLKKKIPVELDLEFGSFKKNILDYDTIVSEFLNNLEYSEVPKSIETCFQNHQGSSSSSAMPNSAVHAETPKSIVTCFQTYQGSSSSSSSSSDESVLGKRPREENDSSSDDEQANKEPERKRNR